MINCLIEGMKKLAVNPVNYEKVKDVQQGQDKNPEVFQRRLVEAFRMDPFGYTFHSPVCPRHQAQNSESAGWSSDSNE